MSEFLRSRVIELGFNADMQSAIHYVFTIHVYLFY